MITESSLSKLQSWYAAHCNGDWEHSWGVVIDTIDNPGWSLKIDLAGTELEFLPFDKIEHRYTDPADWMFCQVKDKQFQGACGPMKLEMLIDSFLKWASEPRESHGAN